MRQLKSLSSPWLPRRIGTVSAKFQVEENLPPKSPIEFQKIRSDRIEREAFYIEKFRDYLFSKDLMARLDAKYMSIQKALGEGNWSGQQGTRYPNLFLNI